MDNPSSAEVLKREEDVIVGGKTETGEFWGELKLGVESGRIGEGGAQKSQRAKKKRKKVADGLSVKNVGDFEEIHNIENIDPNANSEKSIDSAQLNSDLKKMYNKLGMNRYQCLLCEKVMKKSDAVMKHIETHLDLIHPCTLLEMVPPILCFLREGWGLRNLSNSWHCQDWLNHPSFPSWQCQDFERFPPFAMCVTNLIKTLDIFYLQKYYSFFQYFSSPYTG